MPEHRIRIKATCRPAMVRRNAMSHQGSASIGFARIRQLKGILQPVVLS
jgi:hypothetical protein